MMIEIKDLLARFSASLATEEAKKETLGGIISKAIGVNIESGDIEIKSGTVYLNIKPIYKNEIFLKRDIILEKMEESFGRSSPKDIR